MLDATHKQKAKDLLGSLPALVELVVRDTVDGHPLTLQLMEVAEELSRLIDKIAVKKEDSSAELPHLELRSASCSGILYAAVPTGFEWDVFCRSIRSAASGDSKDVFKNLQLGDRSYELETYISAQCPHCPRTVLILNQLALSFDGVKHLIIDSLSFATRTNKAGVSSVPTVFIGGTARWVGGISTEDLIKLISTETDDEAWGMTLVSQLNHGELAQALRTLKEHHGANRRLLDLLTKPDMSNRMTALRLIEVAAEEAPETLEGITMELCKLLENKDDNIRGDAAYALGLIKDPKSKEFLQRALNDPNRDVRETAEEALEGMNV